MSDIIDKLLGFSPEELKRWRRKCRGRGPYKRKGRPKRSKEQLVEYLREKGFTTRDGLRSGRGEGDPTDDDYRCEYGSWTEAMKEIWNRKPLDRKYVAKSIIEFGLWTREGYERSRERRPDVLPSMYAIRREFGSWGVLKEIASVMSLKKTLQAYMELKRRIGKRPTREDCRIAGIEIGTAIKMYGGKDGLDRFVESMEEML